MDEDIWSIPCHTRLLADKPDRLALDSETTGLKWTDTAFGASFAWYVDEELRSGYIDFRTHNDLWLEVKEWIKTEEPEIIAHNFKFDAHKLGLYPQNYQDTCLMVYLLNENYPKGLKVLAEKILKETTDEAEVLKNARKEGKLTVRDGFDQLPLRVVAPYAIKDAEFTLRLCDRLQDALAKADGLEEVYSLEKQLLLCVAGTELRGIGIDKDYVQAEIIAKGDETLALEREIARIVGRPVGDGKRKNRVKVGMFKNGRPKYKHVPVNEFNPNSPAQILEFFNGVGVELSGTDEEALGALEHPLAKALVRLRNVRKNRNTYLVPIMEELVWSEQYQCWVNHPNLNLTRTRTHRMSSSGVKD